MADDRTVNDAAAQTRLAERVAALELAAAARDAALSATAIELGAARAAATVSGHESRALAAQLSDLARALAEEQAARARADHQSALADGDSDALKSRHDQAAREIRALDAMLAARSHQLELARDDAERDGSGRTVAEKALARTRAALLAAHAEKTRGDEIVACLEAERSALTTRLAITSEAADSMARAHAEKASEAIRLAGELRGAREELARASAELQRLEAAEAKRRHRGWLLRSLGQLTSRVSWVALGFLAAAGVLSLARTSFPPVSQPAAEEVASPEPEPPSPASVATPPETPPPASAPQVSPIGIAAYAAVEQRLVRRAEGDGFRVSAKLRTPAEVHAWYAYQASVKARSDGHQDDDTAGSINAIAERFHFDRTTYVEVMVENFGRDDAFDVNTLAQGFTWTRADRSSRATVSDFEEPKVVTGAVNGIPRIEAVTLALEFPEPTGVPARLDFRIGASAPVVMTWEGDPAP